MSFIVQVLKSKIVSNILTLGFVQVVNYVFPILLIPYLLSVLGVDLWKEIVFVQFTLQYFVVLVSYGFEWSAVNKISPVRTNIQEVNRLFSAYWYAQFILLCVALLCLSIWIYCMNPSSAYKYLFFIGFLSVVGVVFFPTWLLQSLEELKLMALTQLVAQAFCFTMIFIFVKSEKDVDYAMLFQSVNGVLAGLLSLYFLYRKGIKLSKFNWSGIKSAFLDGFVLFKSQVWISLYTNTIPVVLGLVSSSNDVAIYALADKIQKMIRFVLSPIGRAIFPRISYLYHNNGKQNADVLFKYSILLTVFLGCLGGITIFLFSKEVVKLLGGEGMTLAPQVVQIFSIMPLVVGLSSVISIQWLIPIGKEKMLHTIWFTAALIAVSTSYPLFSSYGVLGAAYLVVFLEIMILSAMIVVLKRCK